MMHHKNTLERHPELSVDKSARVNYLSRGLTHESTRFISGNLDAVRPGEEVILAVLPGHGFVSTVMLRLSGDVTLDSRVKVYAGLEERPSIDQPVRGFFLTGLEGKPVIADYAGRTESRDGSAVTLYRHLFVPYSGGLRLCLENTTDAAIAVDFSLQIQERGETLDYGRYSKAYGTTKAGTSSVWGEEVVLLDVSGAGVLSAMQMWLENRWTRGQYMEGNIEIYIDHAEFPSYQSTGTEEFFMGGVYFANLHTSAYSGCTRTFNDGTENPRHIVSAYRHFMDDAITFNRHLRVMWHNGQPAQGAVLGTTGYEFSLTWYRDEYSGPAKQISTGDALVALSRVDRDRYELPLRSACGTSDARSGESTLIDIAGPGALESLSIVGAEEEILNSAGIVLVVDGNRTPTIPLATFFQSRADGNGFASSTGKTSSSSYYRYCDIGFSESLQLMVTASGEVSAFAEYRSGERAAESRFGMARLTSGEGAPAKASIEGRGALDAVFVLADNPGGCVLEFTRPDHTPVAVLRLADLLLCPTDFGTEEAVSSDLGLLEVSGTHFTGYRAFGASGFVFDEGLSIRLLQRQTSPADVVVFYRKNNETASRDVSLSAITTRLNVNDHSFDAYETACYNPMEGHDGAIAAGETGVFFEDFDAGVIRGLRFGTPPVGRALHESTLRFYIDGATRPSLETSCGRFFSADFDDPVYWDQTRSMSRVSKVDRAPHGQHTSFFRYIDVPYSRSIRITLTAPADSGINGFDNVYYGAVRQAAQEFGLRNRFECVSREQVVQPGASVILAGHEGRAAVTSIQLMMYGAVGSEYLGGRFQVVSDDPEGSTIDLPIYAYFFGCPPAAADAVVRNAYGEQWGAVIAVEEGYYSAPEHGWIRRGAASGFRNVVYRLLDQRPIPIRGATEIKIANTSGSPFTVQSDVIVRWDGGGNPVD